MGNDIQQTLLNPNNKQDEIVQENLCVHQFFERQVAISPDAIALVFEEQQLTYQELNNRANQLAHYLRKLGVQLDTLVGICAERSFEMIVAVLGVLKAGGAYVPLDPAYPKERLAFMLKDANISILLTQQPLLNILPKQVESTILLDTQWQTVALESTGTPQNQTHLNHLAYCIYTSGSTGQPKGVLLEHKGLCNLSFELIQQLHIIPKSRVLQFASFSFDASVWEMFTALLAGATLYLINQNKLLLGKSLAEELRKNEISVVLLPPTVLSTLQTEYLPQLKTIIVGGEPCPLALAKQWVQYCHFFNAYGPTEATVCTTLAKYEGGDNFPIGRPIANTEVYVLNENKQPVALGEVGELYIGGIGLARGYLNREKLTEEVFVAHPFSNNPDDRLYKTGDLVRYQVDNNLEFVGRADQQVKVRGFRIELEEIESILYQHPSVWDAVVAVREDSPGDKRIVAYVVYPIVPQRIPMRGACLIECLLKVSEHKTLAVTTEDISYGGVGLSEIPEGCKLGQRLRLCLRLPEIPEGMWVEGNVAWLSGPRAGIKFDLNAEQQSLLRKNVDYFLKKQGILEGLQKTFIEQLRKFLQEKLPDYMVPSHFVVLDKLPLMPNGKVDRKALPSPHAKRPESENEIEKTLIDIWKKALKQKKIGLHDDFISLGGHSLLAAHIILRINEVFQTDLPPYMLFEAPTIAKLAKRIKPLLDSHVLSKAEAIRSIPRDEHFPLSFAQQQLWLQNQLINNLPTYNEPTVVYLKNEVDIEVLQHSLNELCKRHEMLRTSFQLLNGKPVQIIANHITLPLDFQDLRNISKETREEEYLQQATTDAKKIFDLTQAPLLRATLFALSDMDFRLCLTMHHIIFDGVSLVNIILPELHAIYEALRHKQTLPELPESSIDYADYATWQREKLQGKLLDKHLNYWKQKLSGLPILQLPTDRPRQPIHSYKGARCPIFIPKKLTSALKMLSQKMGTTLFMSLLATFKVLLYRYTEQEDIAIGTVTSGRGRPELEKVVGFFPNTLVLRTALSGDLDFEGLLNQVRKTALDAYAHEDAPFELVVSALHPTRHLSTNPLFQVAFTLNPSLEDTSIPWNYNQFEVYTQTAKFDLSVELDEKQEEVVGFFEYSTDLFDSSTVTRVINHYLALLHNIVANPQQQIAHIPLLTQKEQQQLLNWNKSPLEMCIHQLFEIQVEKTPEAIAAVFGEQSLTYSELNQRANQLAHYLTQIGVRPEVLVGICVERSIEMIVGVLGVLKAGGAYVPFDPTYPIERLVFMLEDAQVRIVLTQQHLRKTLQGQGALLLSLDEEWKVIAKESKENLSCTASSESLAYIIYTSGSTGQPKGVMLTHVGLCNLAAHQRSVFALKPGERLLQSASFSFDVCVGDIFFSLTSGATLYLETAENLQPGEPLSTQLRKHKITTAVFSPSVLSTMHPKDYPDLVNLVVGTENCPLALASKWAKNRRLLNAYGPTETTLYTIVFEYNDALKKFPIGYPIKNTQAYVLDKYLQQVPIGIPGELHIAGVGLARGYLNRPELTAEKFIANPFSDNPKARMYKTGDLVRYTPDGSLEFLGRIDNQVKLRGFRIELGEIESVLLQHSFIQNAAVIAREDIPGDKRLVAYFVQKSKNKSLSSTELRNFLSQKLPEYMIPSAFVPLEEFPLTQNGKVDYRALPKPEKLQRETQIVTPKSEFEKLIASIWQTVLQIEDISVEDTFFELGGHSLLMVQVQSQLSDALGYNVFMVTLFQYPTIQELANYLEKNKQDSIPQNVSTDSSQPVAKRLQKQQASILRQKQSKLKKNVKTSTECE